MIASNRVALARAGHYTQEDLAPALASILSATDLPDVQGRSLLLKPNILLDTAPEKAATTHPEFLRAAIRAFRERGAAKILVGDSPGFQRRNFQGIKCGLGDVCREEGAEWIDFTREKTRVTVPGGGAVQSAFTVTAIVDQVDLIISLPKLKTHQLMYFTGAMKNLFGLVPGLGKSPYHVQFPDRKDFASLIVDLNLAIPADYALMDAVTAMEGHGPGSGDPRHLGLVLGSANPLALDATACRIIGYDPAVIPIAMDALARGHWLESFDDITVTGLSLEQARIKGFKKIPITAGSSQLREFMTPRFLQRLIAEWVPRPVFMPEPCVLCGDCVKICAAEALTLPPGGKKTEGIRVDYSRCIRCYCCHEICPVRAIAIKRRPFASA